MKRWKALLPKEQAAMRLLTAIVLAGKQEQRRRLLMAVIHRMSISSHSLASRLPIIRKLLSMRQWMTRKDSIRRSDCSSACEKYDG